MQHDYNAFPNQRNAHSIKAAFPHRSDILVHRQHNLLVPQFGLEGAYRLVPGATTPHAHLPSDSPVIRDLNTTWDIRKHAEARKPVSLGLLTTDEHTSFVRPVEVFAGHVLDMPIKFPGTDVRVPGDLIGSRPVIQRIIDTEKRLNPRYDDYYAYLSFHQGWVTPGERQRETPYHVDGFQGPRWTTKHPANHSYLVCDALPTIFYPVDFPLDHIDPNFDDVYAEFAARIERGAESWCPAPLELILMDCYCVHRGIPATQRIFRTWLRISWETRIFDRLGNAKNPLFDYDWKMVARDTDPRIRPRTPAFAA